MWRNMFWCWGLAPIEKCDFNSKLCLVHFTKDREPRQSAYSLSCFLSLFFKWRQEKVQDDKKRLVGLQKPLNCVRRFGTAVSRVLFPLYRSEKAGCSNGKWIPCIYCCQIMLPNTIISNGKKGYWLSWVIVIVYIQLPNINIAVFLTWVT